MMRRGAGLARRHDQAVQDISVLETDREHRLEMLGMAHDPRVVGVIGMIEYLAAATSPFAQEIVTAAERQPSFGPIVAETLRHCHVQDLAQSELVPVDERLRLADVRGGSAFSRRRALTCGSLSAA